MMEMKKLLPFCFLFAVVLPVSENYRILGLFPSQTKSHYLMFERLMRGLAEKGHEVDVLSHFPLRDPPPRYNDMSVRGTIPIFANNISVSYARDFMSGYFSIIDFIVSKMGTDVCNAVLSSEVARNLNKTNTKYDLVITEIYGTDCMLGFAHRFKAPVIGVTSSTDVPWGTERIGNPDNPAYIPNYFVSFPSRMSLLERLENTIILIHAKLKYHFGSVVPSNKIARKFFGNDLPDLQQLIYNVSMIMVNSHFSINFPRPAVPNFIEVGGLHVMLPQPLSKHFENILNVPSEYEGVIYLSMGSMVLTETLPTSKLKAFFEVFKELPYRVLWKATKENMPKELDIPSNIYFEPWMPQTDILCHPNVKLFISHGGLMSTQESIYCGVPRLGIPFFADQTLNLKTSEALGLAIMLDYNDITKENILNSIKGLLGKKYNDNVKRVSQLFKDRPLTPLDTAIYWVEYVIRHNGAPHLKGVGAELPWYQYYLLDVITIIIILLGSFFLAVCFIMKFIIDQVFRFRFKLKFKIN